MLTRYPFTFRKDVQGLRGLAVLLVVLFHAGLPLTGGFIGVDVFFVLSGYVITGGILHRLSEDRFSFRQFYGRRIRRLLPTLALVLCATTLAATFLAPLISVRFTAHTAVAASFLNANHYLLQATDYFNPNAEYNALLHTWSLSVEEQFYLLFPLIIVLAWRFARGRRSLLLLVIAAMSLTSFALCVVVTNTPLLFGFTGEQLAFFSSATRAWQFGAGSILAVGEASSRRPLPSPAPWAGLLLVLGSAYFFSRSTVFPGVAAVLPTVGTALLLLPHSARSLTTFFETGWLVRLGDVSYAWYLWHWPLIVFARATWPASPYLASIIAALVSLPLAIVTERFFETPIRYRSQERRWPVWGVALLCVALPVAALGVHRALQQFPVGGLVADARSYQGHDLTQGCSSGGSLTTPSSDCVSGQGALRIALVGDSNARQYIPAFRDIIEALDATLVVAAYPGCPFVDAVAYFDGVPQSKCARWVSGTIDTIAEAKFDIVVFAGAWDGYTTQSNISFRSSEGHDIPQDARADFVGGRLRDIASRTEATGTRVVFVEPVPKFRTAEDPSHWWHVAGPIRCNMLVMLASPPSCNMTRTLEDSRWVSYEVALAATAAVRAAGFETVNTSDAICPGGVCSLMNGDGWLYHDTGHLNPRGARLMSNEFLRVLSRIRHGRAAAL